MKDFLKKRESKYLIAFIGFMLLLAIPTFKPLMILAFGEEIHLEAVGYDPKDPFRGDYVQVGFVEEVVSLDLLDDSIQFTDAYRLDSLLDDKVLYVSIIKVGDYHRVEKVSLNKPTGLYIEAEFEYVHWSFKEGEVSNEPDSVVLTYNLHRFYVPEGTGLDLENAIRDGEAYSVIKLYRGDGVLTDIRIK